MPINRAEVIEGIQGMARENGGVAPEVRRFCAECGIREHEVVGRLWARWGDALAEAGFDNNTVNPKLGEDDLLCHYVRLARKLRRLPTTKDLRFEAAGSPGFPHPTTFTRRYGGITQLKERVRAWCEANPGNDDILSLLPVTPPTDDDSSGDHGAFAIGVVHLIQSGRYYKIGRSNDGGRRQYEIRLQMPEPVKVLWEIKTDDPEGVEAYRHRRFADRRKGGEWFDLRKDEVEAFRRWRRTV
jgi:hypothetical protein